MRTLLVANNSKYIHSSLGIRSVSYYCKQKGFDIDFCEQTIQTPLLASLAEISSYEPDIIGLDVHIWNKNYVYSLVSLVRKVMPESIIVLGGPEVSFTAASAFCECPDADFIVQGEGEEIFASLLNDLEKGRKVVSKSIAWIDEDGGIQNAGNLAVVEDLAVLPFSYDDMKSFKELHKIAYYECTRGCPFSCSYCLSGISHYVRRKPLDKVLVELDKFIEAEVPLVKFVDRTYNLGEDYFLPIMQHLAEKDTKTLFHFEIKADLLSQNVLNFLKTVPKGRFQFEIGVQTTNQDTLKAIGRKDDWQALVKNVTEILTFGNIHLHLDLIAGLPYEGILSFKQSFNDVYALRPHMLQLGFLKVLKGSLMSQQAEEHEIVYMDDTPYEVLQTKYVPYKEMRFLKVLEDVFEHTYNTGKFDYFLEHIINEYYKADAYAFYEDLSVWWDSKGLYPEGHNIRNVTLLLKLFCDEKFPEQAKTLNEILRFDVFLKQPGWQPNAFEWHGEEIKEKVLEFWRNENIIRKYLPSYDFSTWRKVRKYLPIERFEWHPAKGAGSDFIVLADLTGSEVHYLEIEGKDFYDKQI